MEGISFNGLDLIKYYWYVVHNYFSDYSWQIIIAYMVVLLSVITIISLIVYFLYKYNHQEKIKKNTADCYDEYYDIIERMLTDSDADSEIINDTLVKIKDSYPPRYFIELLTDIRMKYQDIVYFPNLQMIADILGVREYCENNLLKNRDTFNTLQCIAMMQLVISEGRLANYVNAGNKDIRTFARLCYIFCSIDNPYIYLSEELEHNQAIVNEMLLHFIFGWMKINNRPMPNFISYADSLKNDLSSAFILNEIIYYGTKEEINGITRFFHSHKRQTRLKAISLAYILNDDKVNNMLIDMYDSSPEICKQEIIKSLMYRHEDRYMDKLIKWYRSAISQNVKLTILRELVNTRKGFGIFKTLEGESPEKDRSIFYYIESLSSIQQLQEISRKNG